MPIASSTVSAARQAVRDTVARSPIFAVVRTDSIDEARAQADVFIRGGLEMIEVTFSVPGATQLVAELLADRGDDASYKVGMGTVTTAHRAEAAVAAGAEFIVSPNASETVAEVANRADLYLLLGALTPTEIVRAAELGADLVKVYPTPPVGGPAYLSVVRQPLGDIPMLVGGGYGIDEIPDYIAVGATAFGIGSPLLGADDDESLAKIARALEMARS